MVSAAPEFIPTKPCRPERQICCTHAQLLALRLHGVDVFECAHAWVDDASIAYEFSHGADQDVRAPHSEGTDRAGRIATIARMMELGVVFDPLFLRVTGAGSRLVQVQLVDGHHRLRAVQWRAAFAGGGAKLAFNVGGDLAAVRRLRSMLMC